MKCERMSLLEKNLIKCVLIHTFSIRAAKQEGSCCFMPLFHLCVVHMEPSTYFIGQREANVKHIIAIHC